MNVICKTCEKEFDKPQNQINKTINNFCSRSCAATYNNKAYPKRDAAKKCSSCKKSLYYDNTTGFCRDCFSLYLLNNYNEQTIEDQLYKKADASLRFVYIRKRAKLTLKLEGRKKECETCGWDKHVHVAHVKALSEYPLDTKIGVVNDISNLKYLCPNCHWEFDHL